MLIAWILGGIVVVAGLLAFGCLYLAIRALGQALE